MLRKHSKLLLSLTLVAALAACNLPGGAPADATPTPDFALTITALASGGQSGVANTPEAPLALETSTPAPPATAEFTPTPSIPQVTVSVNTNCRTGPGTVYGLIGGLNVGQIAEVVGKNTSTNYWIIKTPGGSGTCWLWGQYATVTGNTAGLPEYPIPPTPTPTATATFTPTPVPPTAVTNLVANKACTTNGAPLGFYYAGGTISWTDVANETGYRVYVGPNSDTIPADSTSYPIPPLLVTAGQPINMGVEAYNAGGTSAKVDIVVTCP